MDRIETVDKAHLASPADDDNERAVIVAAKTQEYTAIFSVYKNALPHEIEQQLTIEINSIQVLEDAALRAAKTHSRDFQTATSNYILAMASFANALKKSSTERLQQVCRELDRLT